MDRQKGAALYEKNGPCGLAQDETNLACNENWGRQVVWDLNM